MKKLRQRSAVRVNSWFTWKAVNSGVGTDRRNSFLFLCWDGNQRRFASWWHDTRNVAKPIMKVTIIKVTAVFFRATNVTFHRFIQESKLDKKCRSGKKAASRWRLARYLHLMEKYEVGLKFNYDFMTTRERRARGECLWISERESKI